MEEFIVENVKEPDGSIRRTAFAADTTEDERKKYRELLAKIRLDGVERERKLPPCDRRRRVNGIDMCYAIGCCEVGDMPCECPCGRECPKTSEGAKPSGGCHGLSHTER